MNTNNRDLIAIDAQILPLVMEARQYPPENLKRKQCLTEIIQIIQESNKLWYERTPYYEDALQQTWLFFCRNICEAVTGKQYDPNRSSIITWLNQYLKWRLHDYRIKNNQERIRFYSPTSLEITNKTNFVVSNLPAPFDISPIWAIIIDWIETDPTGVLRAHYVSNRPDVTCQLLLLRRIFFHRQWDEISLEFHLPVSTLSSFYQRKCLPIMRDFAENQGFFS